MFRTLGIAAVAAVAFAAAPAAASTFVVTNETPASCTAGFSQCTFNIGGTITSSGGFTITSNTFSLPGAGIFSGSVTNSSSGGANIDFSSITLTNTTTSMTYAGTFGNPGSFSFAEISDADVVGGLFTLTLGGSATVVPGQPPVVPAFGGSASFSAAAVPEPATWALFILGFGAMGHTMRRRSTKVRIAKASLNFA